MLIKGISNKEYAFSGPVAESNLENKSGVYAIIDHKNDGQNYLLDVGESATVKDRIATHDRMDCWKRQATGSITYYVYYTPDKQQAGRKEIEQDIRDKYALFCGKQ